MDKKEQKRNKQLARVANEVDGFMRDLFVENDMDTNECLGVMSAIVGNFIGMVCKLTGEDRKAMADFFHQMLEKETEV